MAQRIKGQETVISFTSPTGDVQGLEDVLSFEAVIASSLAKIGGGGRVAGTDPDTRALERIGRLLEQIRDDGRKDVDSEMR